MNKSKNKILYALFFSYLFISLYQINALSRKASESEPATSNISSKNQVYMGMVDKIKDEILNRLQGSSQSPTAIIRATMEYVHNNSLHLIDDEHKRYAFNIPYVLNKMYLASFGDIKEKPHLSCGPRAYAMRVILSRFNIYSRLVQVYSDEYETHEGHRLLEVYNPDSQSWEVWDPDYGVTYVDRETKNPVDILTLVFSDKNNFIPIGISNEGWKITKTERLKNNYFKAVLFEKDSGMTNALIIVNESLFDMDKVFSSGLTFEEWAKKYYAYPRIIILSNEGEFICLN